MNKSDLRIIKTKNKIHLALTDLLKNKDLMDITVTELCREASINRGTFYFHYQEVEDVFKELFEEVMLDLKESYQEPYRQTDILDVKNLDIESIRIFHHVKKYEDFYKVILSEDVSMKFFYMLFDELRAISIESDNVQINEELKDYLISYTTNSIIGLIIQWYRNDFQESADEMNKHLVDILKSVR